MRIVSWACLTAGLPARLGRGHRDRKQLAQRVGRPADHRPLDRTVGSEQDRRWHCLDTESFSRLVWRPLRQHKRLNSVLPRQAGRGLQRLLHDTHEPYPVRRQRRAERTQTLERQPRRRTLRVRKQQQHTLMPDKQVIETIGATIDAFERSLQRSHTH